MVCKCNVVINELLAFVQNKIGVIEDERLVLICNRGFNAVEILAAKDILIKIYQEEIIKLSENRPDPQRNGREMSATHEAMEAIVQIIKTANPNKIPMFVARDLAKIPPLAFDQTGVTRLLREIVAVKSELEKLRHEKAPEVPFRVVPEKVTSQTISFKYPKAATIKAPRISGDRKSLSLYDSPPIETTFIPQVILAPIQVVQLKQQVISPVEQFMPPSPIVMTPTQLLTPKRKKRIKLDLKPKELRGKFMTRMKP